MSIEPIEYRYPYNPNNDLPECNIVDERVMLTMANGEDYQFVIPKASPFFSNSLVVKKIDGAILTVDEDYILTHYSIVAKENLDKDIYGSITFLDKTLNGEFLLTYSTIGGEFTNKEDQTLVRLIKDITGHRSAYWENIEDKPDEFLPMTHTLDGDDVIGMDDVVEAIEELTKVIEGETHPSHRHTIDSIDNLQEELDNKVDNDGYTVFAPTLPVTMNNTGVVTKIVLPKPSVKLGMRIELWISDGVKSSEIVVIGLIKNNGVENEPWDGIQVRGDNVHFLNLISGSYNLNGYPTLYLQSSNGAWKNTTITIPKVVYTTEISDKLTGSYSFYDAATVMGIGVALDNYIYQSQYEHTENRLNKVKINTILGEIVYDVI